MKSTIHNLVGRGNLLRDSVGVVVVCQIVAVLVSVHAGIGGVGNHLHLGFLHDDDWTSVTRIDFPCRSNTDVGSTAKALVVNQQRGSAIIVDGGAL